ncbi:ESPR-type extended signal peptide-containing protein [Haemophilus haemolyticus]|uniref:YadA-like C-terminal region n=1 Tax=Haemophilus haemolyticus TaxID=726 RepID=A0A2X4R5N8_HAEHA|nr:ESPR-type extended signal peptide-containing protein [Haemophilus haemolyticus]SQH97333.1 YadA-like C-terminal region [Haemophilus haemolyticus]
MNQIFRVIWNHATQSWVAVSELTSAKGKTKSKTISKLAALSLVAGTALSMDAMAASSTITAVSKTDGNLAILTNNQDSINAESTGATTPKNVIYIGNGSVPAAIGDEYVAIGNDMNGNSGGRAGDTLIGNRVRSGGGGQDSFSTAVGYGAQVAGPSVAIGVGTSSDIGNAEGWKGIKYSGISIGAFSRVSGSADGGVAMGAISFADQTGSVAIGQLSGAASLIYDREVAGNGGGGVVYRGIDETTGGNLVSIGAEAGARSTSSVAIGTQSTTSKGNDSIAMGTNSAAIKDNSIAIGHAAIAGGHTQADIDALDERKMLLEANKANADDRLKKKTAAAETNPTAENKFQLSAAKAAVERLDLAIRRINADLQRLSSVTTRDATNAIAIGNQSQATDESALAFGNTARAKGVASIAQGKNTQAMAENAIAVGTSSNVSGANSVALGANITKLTTENSVVLGANSTEVVRTTGASHAVQTVNDATVRTIAGPNFTYSGFAGKVADAGHYVSIGQKDKERQIKNLAAGAVDANSTDAINGSQLYALMARVENKQEPVVYTNKAGDKLVKVGDDFYKTEDLDPATGKPLAGKNPVPAGDVIASMNNAGNDTKTPMALANIANNLPKIDNANATVTMPDGETLQNVPEYLAKAPITAEEAAAIANGSSGNNAATVSDVLNAGWNLQNNGEAKDFVKPYDTVNFVDGKGTKAVVESDNETSNVTFNVDTVDMTSNPNGTVVNPMGDNAQKLLDDLAKAKKAVADNPDDEAAKAKLKDAEDAVNKAGGNKIATAQNVANMINNSGFTLKADKVEGGENTTDGDNANNEKLTEKGELIKPGSTVTMKAGKNMTVKHEKDGNITYATKDDVEFNSVTVGPKFVDDQGNPVTKVGDKYLDKDGKEVPADKVKPFAPVAMKTEKAKDATNNSKDNKPTTALNVTSTDGKPTQITGVGSVLDTDPVTTTPGTPVTKQPNLVNLGTKPGENALPDNVLNSAATVRDLANMGWIVSSNKTTDALEAAYKDTVKNANEVKFIGTGAATVSGKTVNGIRTITVDVKQPEPETETLTSTGGKVTNPEGDNAKKLVTAGNIADMINNSGFTLKTDKVEGGENTTNGDNANNEKLTEKGELIKPGSTVTMKAGKNMTVKHEKDGNITYATKDDVEFNTVKVGNDKDGKSPVEFKTEAAKPATNNVAGKQPTTALNITSSDGKPTQITGVASSLNKSPVTTAPNGKDGAKPDDNLVDLANATTPNAAATVGDLQNMGWIVGAPENGYVDTVKNANKVDFKAGAGISVTGKTKDGVREITIGIKDGEVVKPNEDPSSPNTGAGYVTGNKVATAIQKSGFVIGKQTAALASEDFKNEDEKVNPDDQVRFADGNNTKVKLATKESVNNDGTKVTTTTVKVDVTGLPVQYTDKNGTPVTKVGDKYFTVDKDGNPTTTEVKPADLTTNMVNPAAKPNEIGAPTTLGNVKSNLPSVNDADKNAKDVDGNPIAGKDNKSAPIDAAKAADIAKNAGNNAATVSDVLNAGWNLQNNGEARDFVKPYDTVNFVDGKGTKVVVETTNGTTSNVKFDIDTGKITNNDDGSVQGPVTPEMQKALKDAEDAYNSLPPNAPEAVRKAAKQALDDAKNNIANVENKVATAQDVANAINKSGFTLTTSADGGEKISGTPEVINPGKKVEMVAGKNMTVKQESNGKVTYATASNVTFDSVQFGDNGPKITNNGGNINVGTATGAPAKITGVAPGEISATSKDAVNGSQLYAMGNKLQGQINKLGNRMNAGMATSAAMANLLQPHKPGQSVATAGVGQHKNQSAVAVGYSRISDNGKYGVRFSMGANTQGEVTGGAAVGYFW